MLTAGLTGGYATGKSFVGRILEDLGCRLIRADEIGHQVIAPDGPAYADVVAAFGRDILSDDGTIDRRKLAAVVFPDAGRLERLNRIIHPHVFRIQDERIAALAAAGPSVIVVVEAAIMVETGSHRRYQKLIVTACPEREQIRRAMERDGLSREEVIARLKRQMPGDEKTRLADYVIDTSGTKEETAAQTRRVYESLRRLAAETKDP